MHYYFDHSLLLDSDGDNTAFYYLSKILMRNKIPIGIVDSNDVEELVAKFPADVVYFCESKDMATQIHSRGFQVIHCKKSVNKFKYPLVIGFDADGVIFSDESEKIYSLAGLAAFFENEKDKVDQTITPGPLNELAKILTDSKLGFYDLVLITSRGGSYERERAAKSFESYGIKFRRTVYVGDPDKTEAFKKEPVDMFFDDKFKHCETAYNAGAHSCHVYYGISNTLQS
ncbi:hypothetical protein [Carp edema virus]|nr:hypothetical protein [Carp edema virus]